MAKYTKLANYMILLDAVAIKIFEFIRLIMFIIKNTLLFGFVFLIIKEPLKIDNNVFSLIKNLNESLIIAMLLVLLVKIAMNFAIVRNDLNKLISNLSNKNKSIIQTIFYKLVPIGFASRIVLEMNQKQFHSNLSNLVVNFLVILLIIKLMNVMINKTSQTLIDDIEYIFNKRINEVTVNDYNKIKFIEIIDRTTHKSYKNEYTIDTYKLKLFKLVTFTITDYGLRKSFSYDYAVKHPYIQKIKFI